MNRLACAALVLPLLLGACGGSSPPGSTVDMAHVVIAADLSQSAPVDLAVAFDTDMASPHADLLPPPPDMTGPPPPTPPLVVESCGAADYVDLTATNAIIDVTPWTTSLGKKCLRVTAGAKVRWAATSMHPLESTGGTMPTPVPASPGATTTTTVTFPSTGVYGYQCSIHISLMHGAIWVVP